MPEENINQSTNQKKYLLSTVLGNIRFVHIHYKFIIFEDIGLTYKKKITDILLIRLYIYDIEYGSSEEKTPAICFLKIHLLKLILPIREYNFINCGSR